MATPNAPRGLMGLGLPAATAVFLDKRLEIYPEDFGAIGDGTTDNYTWLTRALTYLSSQGGGTLTCPPVYKVYAFSQPITLPNNVTIKGAGDLTTFFKYTGSTKAAFITDTGSYLGIRLNDLHVDLSSNTNAVAGIDCRQGLTRGCFQNVRVTTSSSSTHGIILRGENPDNIGTATQGAFNNIFENCIVKSGGSLHSGYGLYLYGVDITDGRCNNNTVLGGDFEGTLGAVFCNGHGNVFISGNTDASTIGHVFGGNQTYQNTIIGWYYDAPTVTVPIKLLSSATQAAVFSAINCIGVTSSSNVTDQVVGGRQRYSITADSTIYAKNIQADNVPKAWVTFTGSTGAVQKAFNVSSVTRNGAGDYTVTFTNALPSANIGISGSVKYNTGGAYAGLFLTVHNSAGSFDTGGCRIDTIDTTNTPQDGNTVFVQFYCLNA